VLGICGRQGLDLATLWGPPGPADPGAFAFRMYLNYDGKGGAFGGTSVRAVSADQGRLAVYAAQRSTDHALTVIVINKTHRGLASPVSVGGLAASATARVFQYGKAHPAGIVTRPGLAFTGGKATLTFPAYSITELVVPASGLARAAARLPRASGTAPAGVTVAPARATPPDGFLRAAGFGGARVANGWNPRAVSPVALTIGSWRSGRSSSTGAGRLPRGTRSITRRSG
jgi:hypothetical protein